MICWHMFYTTSLMNHKLIVLCVLGLHIIVSVMHWSVQINLIDFKSKIQNITWFARSKMAKVLCAQRSHCDSTFGGGWEGHRVVPVGTGQERSWKSVCVYLLKRSKTCTCSCVVFMMIFLADFQRIVWAGGQSSLMLLCPMKLCIKEGRVVWSTTCTCYMSMVMKQCCGFLPFFLWKAVVLHLQRNIFFHDFGAWCLSFC